LAKFSLFGFKIGKDTPAQDVLPSFSPPVLDDGAVTITAAAHYGTTIDLDSNYKNDVELITRYREMAMQPEIESAVDDIINEAIVNEDGVIVKLKLDNLKVSPKIKKAIEDEFSNILTLLNFKQLGQDIFRRYYIDGRMYYNIILDKEKPNAGIQELRYTDPRKITKIREIKKVKDQTTGYDIVAGYVEYYIYSDTISTKSNLTNSGLRIAPDSMICVTSGLLDAKRSIILSNLHKAIKPLNQLRMIEDASVIYKVSRAPERRIFYIDVGNLPKMKAEQYLKDIMTKYKNKVVYDATTGEIRDDRRFLSMMDDFWLPRRSDNKSTEITTLPSSAAFDDMSMVEYFEKKLYKALNVPFSRLQQPDNAFDLGTNQVITRDEIKFDKFVQRQRNKFTELFDQALKVQCQLKGICSDEEFDEYKQDFNYDFVRDNNYAEMRDGELLQNRLNLLAVVDPYKGVYYSQKWIQKNILQMDEEEIEDMQKEIEQEIADELYPDPKLMNDPTAGFGAGNDQSDEEDPNADPDGDGIPNSQDTNDQDPSVGKANTKQPVNPKQQLDKSAKNPYYD
jgi:hypothetical protein